MGDVAEDKGVVTPAFTNVVSGKNLKTKKKMPQTRKEKQILSSYERTENEAYVCNRAKHSTLCKTSVVLIALNASTAAPNTYEIQGYKERKMEKWIYFALYCTLARSPLSQSSLS